jgi:hypothetical protein
MPNRSLLALVLAMLLGACSSADDSGAQGGDGGERGGASGGNSAPTLALAGASIDEGDDGSATLRFVATLSAASDKTVTAKFRTQDGSAAAGQDYAGASGQVAFGPGTTQQFIDVTVNGDTAIEADETFTVQLYAATHAQLTADTAEGRIVNDDHPVVSVADAETAESGSMSFTITITPAAPGPISFDYATADGSARAGSDYTGTHGRLTVPAGAQSAEIVVPTTPDTFDENDETFTLGLSNPEHATLGTALATGTIRDDDDKGLLRVGAAKRSITPTQAQIDGIEEPRAFGAGTHVQKFNLGGFGINPLSNTPDDPFGGVQTANASLTEPASHRVYTNPAGVDENTTVRAFAVEQPGGDTVVFLMMDAVGAGNVIQKGVKSAVIAAAAQAGVTLAPENILFGQTHSHAGADLQGLWGGVPQQWISDVLYPAAAAAVSDALAARQPARLSFKQGNTVEFNNYRRPRIEPTADADGTVTLLEAATDDGAAIGSVLGYNAHPTSVNEDGNRLPHPDYILGAQDWLENHVGGVALYYNGPIADASGSGSRAGCIGGNVYANVRCRGEGIADYLLNPAHALAARELAPTVAARSVEVYLPVTNPGFLAFGLTGSFNRYYNFMDVATDSIPGIEPYLADLPQLTPVARTYVSRITLGGPGGLEIVTIPGESTNTFGQYIRGLAGTNVMLLGLTHNSFGYILPEDEFSYVDQTGDAGLVVPFTGYEEMVSLGPLTAPMLRTQAYNVLFDQPPEQDVPPSLAACLEGLDHPACFLRTIENRIDLLISQWLIAGVDAAAAACHAIGAPEAICSVFDSVAAAGSPGAVDLLLAPELARTAAQGCDFLDTAQCQFPFPNDFFTVDATPGSPQAADQGGTGRRVNFNIAGMPRNSAGKPVDPTEWNRNDGFSPGQLIVTYVPGLKANADGTIPGAVAITDVARSYDADAPIFVIDADTGERHLVWAEIDLNANLLLHGAVPQTEESLGDQQRPLNDGRAALIIRPAKNFEEGHRYIVALRNLKGANGETLMPGLGFRACRGDVESSLRYATPMRERCDHIEDLIGTLEAAERNFDADDLYLAWDFTVASAKNNVSRLAHMRDAAFNSLATVPGTDCTRLTAANVAACAAPQFTVDTVTEHPQTGIARRIEGTLTVPSFVVPVEATPADNEQSRAAIRQFCSGVPQEDFNGGCQDVATLGGSAALPPNRLFYNPADATPTDPTQARYGDGLPDSVGTMQSAFMCQIPEQALTEPARASIYGHGLLDSRTAVTYEGSPEFEREHNFMYCAVDLFGFATGDIGNVASTLVDVSNFPVIPDGSQQGLLNYMFLARAIQHPNGFLGNAAFQNGGAPLFDRREVFYNGNSQGGIVGGAVMAISKDINRGVLGSLGMNYSTLLQRSKDFDPYSTVIYSAYTEPLDRMFLFSMMQMLWDRSENNGYAGHLTRKSEVEGGPIDHVMLNSMFADQQVTMWSADVMARTMDIPVDYAMIDRSGHHHPDLVPGWPQPRVGYHNEGDAQYADVGSVLFDYNSREISDNVPIGNVPMREGPDPHDSSHRRRQGRCQISHWLQRDGRLLDLNTDAFTPEAGDHAIDCPAVRDNSGAPAVGDTTVAPVDLADALAAALDRFGEALATIPGHLADGNVVAALDAVIGGAQQVVADVGSAVTGQAGSIAGIAQPPPGPNAAPELPAPEQLLAGAAKRPIQVPVGTPLGGYLRPPVGGEYIGDDPAGEITDNVPSANDSCDPTEPASCLPNAPLPDEARKAHSPYATFSPPSRGYYDSLIAKAVALYDGHDYVVMVKTDFIGMLDEVVQDVKADVKARAGIDLGDGLIMSATHSHDGPGALANHSTRYFWLAMDAYQHDVYRRLVGQLADVVIAALDDLKPARIGHGNGLESPQVGNGINGYRRGRLDSYKDNDRPGCEYVSAGQCPAGINDADELRKRIGILRVDDAATGTPIAVVINFADHGIAFDVENQYFSGDVLGSIEREVEQSFVKPAGDAAFRAPIAMLVQNTGGDVTPKNVPYSIRGIEMLGKRMAPQVRAVADAIDSFEDQPDLRTVSQRVVLNRERLGYAEDEYPYPWGAAQCGNDLAVPFADVGVNDIPGYEDTGLPTKHLYCIPATPPDSEDLADNGVAENGAFVPGDTILKAAKIGGITLIVQPGEPLTEYGVRSLEMAQAEGYSLPDTFVWGYSSDHVGYILPPVKEDWATFGGAESTTTFWGWKQGERFINGHRELLRALRDGTAAPADEFQLDYSLGNQMVANVPAAQPTSSLLPGQVVAEPQDIARFAKTLFTWEGGDPVVDFPAVVMQHADGTPVRRANGEVIDTFFEMHLKYRLVSGRHLWTVEFEAPKDWAAGGYRFAVTGKAEQGGTIGYALQSRAFTVAPAANLAAENFACAGGSCSVSVRYQAVPMNYRIVDASVDPENAAPMRAGTVAFSNGSDRVVATGDGNGNFVAAIAGNVSASAADAWGNTAPTVGGGGGDPDTDGDGVPDSSDQCDSEPGPASNNGCPEQGGDEAFPIALCEPFADYCISDIPFVGPAVQDALDTAWNTIMDGGGEPPPADVPGTGPVDQVVAEAGDNAQTLPADAQASAEQTVDNAANGTLADRSAEVVVMEGKSFPDWSQPAAMGLANPYPSGVGGDGAAITGDTPFYVRSAHNGTMLYPPAGFAGVPTAARVGNIAAFRYANGAWIEIPVQVDERFPYFLANANSDFSFYSGTDMELTYAWDRETWKAQGECYVAPSSVAAMADPVPGLDDDDEIAFMAGDAGEQAPAGAAPQDATGGQEIALADPLSPGAPKFVYLFRRTGGTSYDGAHYVEYARDADADQWVDRSFWADSDPQKIGTSNAGYGPNLSGTVCPDGTPRSARASSDRFPRDGMTVTTDKYKVYASGRWMVRNVHIAKPGQDGVYGADLVDRWKGRAFQQSPDSVVSLVGFEDEQVNWEANSALLGERVGPIRAIREIWGADSGTNVTKTETYYRDAYVYRFRARVHPIPPDGLYTSWDYNRGAMVPAPGENVPGGRYYTAVRGTGVPIDGVNDDVGQVDQVEPVAGYCITSDGPQPAGDFGGVCPLFFDTGDPALNLPLTMYNWEQIAAKGNLGSLVYLFELKSPTIGANSVAMPYYRDDACLDDGTGDDPVQRPWPGEAYRWNGGAVPQAYDQRAGRALDHSGATFVDCIERQGAHAQHGIHFFAPPESDNATLPVAVDEIDGQQWAFAVPMSAPANVGERYANLVRAPLVRAVTPRPATGGDPVGDRPDDVPLCIDGAGCASDLDEVGVPGSSLQGAVDAAYVAIGDALDQAVAAFSDLIGGGSPTEPQGHVLAGVGVVDMTPDVGYGAGQYANKAVEDTPDGTVDPYATGKSQVKSYGVVSRLTARAIVIEGSNGKRIALLKSDNYLAQDNLVRRVGQILAEHGSSIGYDQILYGVTHAHSTTYVATASAGVWVFQDAYDARFFENQARKLAQAVLDAERNLAPARMGATTVRHKLFKGNVMGPASGDDGTPVQYPTEYGDHGLVVMRIETDEAEPKPIAVWVNWGEHPEGLDGYNLHSADYVAFLERFVERDLGAPLVFSQGDVGSSEKSGNDQQRLRDDGTVCEGPGASGPECKRGEGTWRDWNHKGYAQNERNVRYLADAVLKGWRVIGGDEHVDHAVDGVLPNNYVPEVQVAMSNAFPVETRTAWVPGPLSHPYPAVSACRSESTVGGDPGVPNAAECSRPGFPGFGSAQIWDTMKAEGLPVPENYDLSSFGALEENNRLKLQVVRLGDMVLGSCACEAQVDLILNFESRANDVANDVYDGFDWACVAEDKGEIAADPAFAQACALQRSRHFDVSEFPTPVPGSLADAAKVARMRAQVHNDAAGWDAPEYAPYANAEPADAGEIKGNFTKEELPAARGYKLAVGIGHAGDYNGYTVSYREYMSHDHYRKELTSYGPHTADYMVTRLVRMAGAMKGAPELAPEPLDVYAQADEERQLAYTEAHGAATKSASDAFYAALAPEPGSAHALGQPADVGTFSAADFTWAGGSTAVDNPRVVVERLVDGHWTFFAGQTGEVQTRVQWPTYDQLPLVYAGQFEWRWTANFEAYESFPARLGSTPAGTYRFTVDGCFNDGAGDALADDACHGAASTYALVSEPFEVIDAAEVVQSVQADANGDLAIRVSATSIPRSYESAFPFVRDDGGTRYCKECSFRPWATSSAGVESVRVDVAGEEVFVSGAGPDWSADANLAPGDSATITVTYTDGRVGRPITYSVPGGDAPPPVIDLPPVPAGF